MVQVPAFRNKCSAISLNLYFWRCFLKTTYFHKIDAINLLMKRGSIFGRFGIAKNGALRRSLHRETGRHPPDRLASLRTENADGPRLRSWGRWRSYQMRAVIRM